jgi:hypothetical protein
LPSTQKNNLEAQSFYYYTGLAFQAPPIILCGGVDYIHGCCMDPEGFLGCFSFRYTVKDVFSDVGRGGFASFTITYNVAISDSCTP